MKKQLIKKSTLAIGLLAMLGGSAFADSTSGGTGAYATSGNFQSWANNLLSVFSQFEAFLMIAAVGIGLYFVFSGLMQYKKFHSASGAQGEHVKHGSGHLIIGVILICIVPAVQMLQATLMTGAGASDSQSLFTVNASALSDSSSAS